MVNKKGLFTLFAIKDHTFYNCRKRIGGDVLVARVKEEQIEYTSSLLDVRNDVVFKAIFGQEKNDDILLSLLNAILREDLQEITYLDTYHGADYADEKSSVLDIRVRTKEKIDIDIEMQFGQHDGFEGRMLMYWARMFSGQLKTGQNYAKLKKTIQISIVNFKRFATPHFHSTFHLLEKKERIQFTSLIEIHMLELPKVGHLVDFEDDDALKNWMLFLSGDKKTKEALAMRDAGISRAYEELEHVSQDEIMRERALKREKFLFEQAMRFDDAKNQGIKQGIEQGIEQGRNESILSMHDTGMPIETIARLLKLTEERVRSVINLK